MITKPTMIRLRQDTRELLEKAANDQRRSMASVVEEAVKAHLAPDRKSTRLNSSHK